MLPFGDLLETQAVLKIARGDLPPRPVDPIVIERGCDHRVWTLMTNCWKFEPGKRLSMEDVRIQMTAPGNQERYDQIKVIVELSRGAMPV